MWQESSGSTGDGRSSSSPFPPDIRMCDDTFPEGGKGLFLGGRRGRLAHSLFSGALIWGRRQEEKGKGSEEEGAIT